MMRKLLLLLLLVQTTVAVNAANYYFSTSNGDDSRSSSEAQNPSTPWKTIDKLNSIMYLLRPGDNVYFKRGESFPGSLHVTASGSDKNPITFSTYGSGYKPIITGFSKLENWYQVRNNVWETDFTAPADRLNIVVRNNQELPVGRYPNVDGIHGGYYNIDKHNGLYEITSSDLSGSPDWTGADIVIRKNRWVIDRSRVSYHVGTTIGFDIASTNNIWDNYGFFIVNHTNTLDKDGEWFYDKNRHKLQMYFADNNPGNSNIKASAYDQLATIAFQHYITFNNLTFAGSNGNAFDFTNSSDITIDQCNIKFVGINGVEALSCDRVTLSDNKILNVNNNGVYLHWNCNNSLVTGNNMQNTGSVPGMGLSNSGNYQGIVVNGNNNLIQYNELDSTGSNGIHIEGDYVTVKNNFVNTFGFVIDDCGGIYTGQGLGNNTQYNSKSIIENIVINGMGAIAGTDNDEYNPTQGIYLDDNTNHVTVIGNTTANCGQSGIFNHNATNNNISNNTMYNNGKEQFLGVRSNNPISNVTFTNNILFSKVASQLAINLASYMGDNIGQFGNFNNNYYCRPIDNNYMFFHEYYQGSNYGASFETLDTWQALYGFDQGSKTSPVTFPAFTSTSKSNNNMYNNGTFSENISNVSSYSSINDISTTWNPNKLDGGTLQVSSNNFSSSNNFMLTLPLSSGLVAGRSYVLSFSLQGATGSRPLEAYLRRSQAPNYDLTTRFKVPVAASRKEVQLAFVANSTDGASIELDVAQPKSTMWIDNVTLQEASVNYTNPDDYIVFAFNASTDNKQVSLPNGTYYDATGKQYNNNVTLKPYESVVLIKDDGRNLMATSTDKVAQNIALEANLVNATAGVTNSSSASDLTWEVENQNSNATTYEVERSSDAVNFSSVGNASVKKDNGSSSAVSYHFNDRNPLNGKNYYRVKQYDEKGVFAISPVVMINNIGFKLNPNPARDVLNLVFDQPIKSTDGIGKQIVIRNTAGVTVKTALMPATSNISQVKLDVSALSRGTYILSITAEGKQLSKTFLKQ